ncbi:MAG: hypothetical protein MI976_25700 [Pseudomonadales bacterium]|nr:hypothetical protein [Pseudomonadales bacterium]
MQVIKLFVLGAMLAGVGILAGCATSVAVVDKSGNSLVGADNVVTLVNLHPDTGKGMRFTAINWQMPMVMPMCSEVSILEANSKKATILDKKSGLTYTYYNHKSNKEPFELHLQKYFGTSCDAAKVAKLSQIDRKGIKNGKIYKGMTKQGVIYAAGYPPMHVTPTTEMDTWKYWKNRWDTLVIYFDNGKVSNIID